MLYFLLIGLGCRMARRSDHERAGIRSRWKLVVGVIGALLGGFQFGLIGLSSHGLIGSLVTATVGAVVLLYVVGQLKKA